MPKTLPIGEIDKERGGLERLRSALTVARWSGTHQRARVIVINETGDELPLTGVVMSTTVLGADIQIDSALVGELKLPQRIELVLPRPDAESPLAAVIVAATPLSNARTTLSCRFIEDSTTEPRDTDQRRGARWRCLQDFQPTGVAANPFRSNDFIFFRVVDISPNGLGILTSVRNKFLTKGCQLDSLVSFPIVGRLSLTLRVRSLRITSETEKDYLHAGVEFSQLTDRHRKLIGQYVLQFGDSETTLDLQRHGFMPADARRAPHWSFVNDENSYREALNLRYLAYSEDGKLTKESSISDAADAYDARSRIIIGRIKGRVIATARVHFPEHGDRIEHEEFLTWPRDFPRREEIVEVTRTCTHPEFRRGNVFFSLLQFIVVTATQAQRRWVITSSTPDLVPFYDWVGLKPTDIVFNHPSLNSRPHRLLLGSIPDALNGTTVGATAWYMVWRDAISTLDSDAFQEAGKLGAIRSLLYRVVGSAGSLFMRIKRLR